jgi:hypothetical protein
MSKSEDKIVKQSDPDSQEQTENKECLLGNRESHPLSPPAGGYVSLSYPSPDLVKQRFSTPDDSVGMKHKSVA